MDINTNMTDTCGNTNCQIGKVQGDAKLQPQGNMQLPSCAKCKKIKYCSRDCQKEHWPVHKLICKKSIELVNPINDAKREIRKIKDPVLQAQSRSSLHRLCTENRDDILATMAPTQNTLSGEEYFKNNSLSDIRDITQKELSSLLAEIERLNKCKQILNDQKLELEDVIDKCARELGSEFDSEYINRYCAPEREELDTINSKIAKIDTAIESCTDMHCRMRILICDSYTVPTLCIKCKGATKFKDNTVYRCIKCKMAIYCSIDCMRDDHIAHQLSCKKV
uniref:MYND-type domain-containing protein n=1 Tax=viral metagenome TaxID=1070528 RepID=A0A6C0HZX2_9ZZZZ